MSSAPQTGAAGGRESSARSPPARSASATAPAGSSAPRTSPGPASAASGRMARRRARGVASAIPRKYRGVSLERPPISDMARDPRQAPVYKAVKRLRRGDRRPPRRGRGPVADGRRGHRQDDPRDAGLEGRARGRANRRDLLAPAPPGAHSRAPTTPRRGEQSYPEFFERLTSVDLLHIDDLGAEKRSDWVLEQLYSIVNERYESAALDGRHHQPRPGGARGADRPAHGLAPGRDLRRSAAPLRRRPALPARRSRTDVGEHVPLPDPAAGRHMSTVP